MIYLCIQGAPVCDDVCFDTVPPPHSIFTASSVLDEAAVFCDQRALLGMLCYEITVSLQSRKWLGMTVTF